MSKYFVPILLSSYVNPSFYIVKQGVLSATYWVTKIAILGCIHNTSFSLQLINGLNKSECYLTLSLKGLPGTNTLAYLGCLCENIHGNFFKRIWSWMIQSVLYLRCFIFHCGAKTFFLSTFIPTASWIMGIYWNKAAKIWFRITDDTWRLQRDIL